MSTEPPRDDHGAEHKPDERVVGARPEQRGDNGAAKQEDAAHRGSACFFAMQFKEFIDFICAANGLAELEG